MRGLYAITDDELIGDDLLYSVEQALQGGAQTIQYRDKSADKKRRLEEADALQLLCSRYGVPLIINDDIRLAAKIRADGVHLGKGDGSVVMARQLLGEDALIGVSCYNKFSLAKKAAKEGADYVAFGAFFPSKTKPEAVLATTSLLTQGRAKLDIPLVAIGGITVANAAVVIRAGASMVAVIDGVFGQRDIKTAAQNFRKVFENFAQE